MVTKRCKGKRRSILGSGPCALIAAIASLQACSSKNAGGSYKLQMQVRLLQPEDRKKSNFRNPTSAVSHPTLPTRPTTFPFSFTYCHPPLLPNRDPRDLSSKFNALEGSRSRWFRSARSRTRVATIAPRRTPISGAWVCLWLVPPTSRLLGLLVNKLRER